MHQSFLETDYIVFKNHKFENNVVLKINQKVLDIDSANELTQPCAFITAWNPLPDILSLKENRKRSEELKNDLIKRGYVFHEAMGISSDKKWSEESYFIEGIDLDSANEISQKYGQKAFVFCDSYCLVKLIYTQ